MGPLFSLALFATLSLAALVATFLAVRIFFPTRSAALLSAVFLLGSALGATTMAIVDWIGRGSDQFTSSTQVQAYFGKLFIAAILFGLIAAKIAYTRVISKK